MCRFRSVRMRKWRTWRRTRVGRMAAAAHGSSRVWGGWGRVNSATSRQTAAIQALTSQPAALLCALELGALAEVPPKPVRLQRGTALGVIAAFGGGVVYGTVRMEARRGWRGREATDRGEAGWQGTQQAGSGVEALCPPGPGRWGADRVRSKVPEAPRAASRQHQDNRVPGWLDGCDAGVLGATASGRQHIHELRLARACAVGAGVGIPEARALRRAPLNGQAVLATARMAGAIGERHARAERWP